jgi:hypothetical protein|tara:strand:- start:940 stop:3369 length:2430 start_codon:yes stop_codon:yes gene_type:complete
MAERIVSPGVFTREKDLSFLPQGVAEIGAAVVGPTLRGPAFTPTVITSASDFEAQFGAIGGSKNYYTGIAVQRYLNGGAPSVTVVRVLGIGGYSVDAVNVVLGSGHAAQNNRILATLLPSRKHSAGLGDLTSTLISGSLATGPSAGFGDYASGSVTVSVSGSDLLLNSIPGANFSGGGTNAVTSDPQDNTNHVYMYKYFNQGGKVPSGEPSGANSISSSVVTLNLRDGVQSFDANGNANTWTGNSSYSVARTPYIISQRLNGAAASSLFRIYTRGSGTEMNERIHIAISNIKAAASNNTSPDFAQFDLQVYLKNDSGVFSSVENFNGCNLDPKSSNFVVAMIGDGHEITDNNGKITKYSNYGNKAQFIRIGDYTALTDGTNPALAPMGFGKVNNPIAGGVNVPSASFVTSSDSDLQFDPGKFPGWDFSAANYINNAYLAPIPLDAGVGANVSFSLEDLSGSAGGNTGFANASTQLSLASTTNVQQRKFKIPMQWGFDGDNPAREIKFGNDIVANNTQGLDCSTAVKSGSVAYKRALNTLADPDFIDINMLATPGIIHAYHPAVSNKAMSIASNRGDTFYILDGSKYNESVANAISNVASIDNNYVATYFPWVQISNPGGGPQLWVPPSVVMLGVFSQNDRIGQEWFAPAGLNRGGIAALDVKKVLTHTDRDELYDGKVNPIASFPGQGIVAFGQKTLQSRPSALDRINVRRLLINLKKFIASSSRFLVFEQNTAATRNRFLNIVNPYMESVQQRSGLSAFRVVMDDSNNTPEVVDRNQLIGQIFIQPTRTAEFIVLDFVVLPTGAAFPE